MNSYLSGTRNREKIGQDDSKLNAQRQEKPLVGIIKIEIPEEHGGNLYSYMYRCTEYLLLFHLLHWKAANH